MNKKYLPILLILLVAFTFRLYQLTEIPPGLTHDEANHGWDSIKILDGVLLFYFPLNYGSEPLYNYIVAGNMALIGENLFALRLVTLFFSLLAIAATYRWSLTVFGSRVALVGASLMAISFWPLATSRQALRAGILPFLMVMAVIFCWRLVREGLKSERSMRWWWLTLGLALFITATLHTYLAARVLWLVFPLFVLYLLFFQRDLGRRVWLFILAGVAGGWLLTGPMFAYVAAHPEAETRLQMLDGPLQNLVQGNLGPVLNNVGRALLAFFWPGFGDQFLAYNIPGRPVLSWLTAVFFLLGLAICLWRWRKPAYLFLVIWFVIGISPSLVTGPTANTTRNLGALPTLYILPAVGFVVSARWLERVWPERGDRLTAVFLGFWLMLAGWLSLRDYFVNWAQSPDVRAAYQHTLVEELAYVEEQTLPGEFVLSTVYPGAAHDPSIARVLAPGLMADLRWVDGRGGLIFPGGEGGTAVVPSSTPLHDTWLNWAERLTTVELRADDLDPVFTVYQLEATTWPATPLADFGGALHLLEAQWRSETVRPGDVVELITVWQVIDPTKVGPLVPPAFATDVVFFTHLLRPDETILAQHDALDAPSWGWRAGDIVLQRHALYIGPETESGLYETAVGVYDRLSGQRLPIINEQGEPTDTRFFVTPLPIDE